MPQWRNALAALGCGVLLTACTAVGGDIPHLHRYQPGSGGAIQISETLPNKHYAFDDITMCIDGEGTVNILAATAVEPTGGMAVVAFAVRPARDGETSGYVSDPSESLVDAGFPSSGAMTVSTSCADEGESDSYRNYTRLGIEVTRTDPAAGTSRGIRVSYESSGKTFTIDYPLALGLCAGPVTDDAECAVEPISMG